MRAGFARNTLIALLSLALVAGGTILATADEPAVSVAVDGPEARLTTGDTDHVAHGTAWVAQREWKFQKIIHYGWGTWFKKRLPGNEWIHVSIPWTSYLDGSWVDVKFVQFCAQSTNGTVTKPIRVDIWENDNQIASQPIAWPADNLYHCVDVNFTPSYWAESIGVSVLVHFENKADKITFYKAWATATP